MSTSQLSPQLRLRTVIVAMNSVPARWVANNSRNGLAALRGNEWVAGAADRLNVVKVSVADVRVEREVRLQDFKKWVERAGTSPREVADKKRIRSILELSVSQ